MCCFSERAEKLTVEKDMTLLQAPVILASTRLTFVDRRFHAADVLWASVVWFSAATMLARNDPDARHAEVELSESRCADDDAI